MKTIAKQLRLNEDTVNDVMEICAYYRCNFSDAIRFAVREWAAVLRSRQAAEKPPATAGR